MTFDGLDDPKPNTVDQPKDTVVFCPQDLTENQYTQVLPQTLACTPTVLKPTRYPLGIMLKFIMIYRSELRLHLQTDTFTKNSFP